MKSFFVITTLLLSTTSAFAQLNKIVPIKLAYSNAYLIRGSTNMLIDCGAQKDWPKITTELAAYGLKPEEIKVLILTHGHADHAGSVANFSNGVTRVLGGKGDLDMFTTGLNTPLKPTGFFAMFLKLFVPNSYQPFFPSTIIDSELDLAEFGYSGKIIPMPGHTPGSLVVVMDQINAFVGDMVLGGYMGGALMPSSPTEHYFHDDRERNRSNIGKLLGLGIQTFYLGHGGPVERKDVLEAFRILSPEHFQKL